MLFFIQYKGEEMPVRVENRNEKLFVKVGEQPEKELDISFIGNDVTLIQNDQVFAANISCTKENLVVWRAAGNVEMKVESEYKRIVNLLRGTQLLDENNVYAKMPGKIAKLLVKSGALVDKGTPILVMEAMKMENEIKSNIKAEVVSIKVSEGQAVETGALLIELKPIED